MPSPVLDAWRALYRECWTAQADALLSGNEAVRCAVPRNDEGPPGRSYRVLACRCCGGALVRLVDAPVLPPPLAESLERIAARRTRLWGRR